jgi:hypothetical protein
MGHQVTVTREEELMAGADGTVEGTLKSPKLHDGPSYSKDDMKIHVWWHTYRTGGGLVAAEQLNVIFTIDRPAKDVWPYLRDFNLWQNEYGYHYPAVIGDLYNREDLELGAETFQLTLKKAGEPDQRMGTYVLLRVIPEHLMVFYEPVPQDGSTGGVSPGFHVFAASEHDGKTTVTYQGEHASRSTDKSEEEALAHWKEFGPRVLEFWRDSFIPNLRQLVHEGTAATTGGG